MIFKYKDTGNRQRPIIPIEFVGKDRNFKYEVLVDSGADICLFHEELAELLDIELDKYPQQIITGVGGNETLYFLADVKFKFKNKIYEIRAGFMKGLGTEGSVPYGIVGQKGFFEFFKITFDTNKSQLDIKKNK